MKQEDVLSAFAAMSSAVAAITSTIFSSGLEQITELKNIVVASNLTTETKS